MRVLAWFDFKQNWPLYLIMAIYGLLAAGHSLVAPLTVGNDEWAHFRYVRFLAEHDRLPTTMAERAEASYKADAPPLYHLLVSTVTAGIEPERLLRPLDSPRRRLAAPSPDAYGLLHIATETFPYGGEVLLWRIGRAVSIFFGLVMIWLTYRTSLELIPQRRYALLAAAWVAFLPAFIFHSSVLSYESLSAVFTALFLWVSIKAIKRPDQWRWWLASGALAGLSITTKYSAVLLPFEIIFILWLAFRRSQAGDSGPTGEKIGRLFGFFWPRLLLSGAAFILAVSWWFGFVLWHFNTVDAQGPWLGIVQPLLVGDASDTTSVNVAGFLFGRETVDVETQPRLERNYGRLFLAMAESFWAAPVAGEFVASPWLTLSFSLAALLGVIGLAAVWSRGGPTARTWLLLLTFHSLLIVPLLLVRILFSFDPREAAQGRHMLLPAASAIPILLVWGWAQLSAKIGRFVVAGLLVWSVAGQLGWAARVYPAPLPVWPGHATPEETGQLQRVDETIAGGMRLRGFTARQTTHHLLEVTLWWEALALMPEDYLIELTLLDREDKIVGYSLSHPVQGRFPTRAWEPGDVIEDRHWLPLVGPAQGEPRLRLRLLNRRGDPVPGTQTVQLNHQVGFSPSTDEVINPCQIWNRGRSDPPSVWSGGYPVHSTLTVIRPELPSLIPLAEGPAPVEQTPVVSAGEFHVFLVEPNWSERYRLSGPDACPEIRIEGPDRNFTIPAVPQPLEVNFNDEVKLLGYELPTHRIQPGERLPVTLYWQALTYIGEDYVIFDNLLDSQQRRWGGYDRQPRDGYSTLLWVPGEVITDAFGVPVDQNAPDGVYLLDIGLYRETPAGPVSLPQVVDGQPIDQNSVRLGPIKVGGPPPGVTTRNPTPDVSLNQPFGDQVTLLGYDRVDQDNQAIQNDAPDKQPDAEPQRLQLVLYWQVEAVLERDYTTFLHLRDASNQTVAQHDTPPANGRYPTRLWDQGEVIVDEISVDLAGLPAGQYIPTVGLYEFATGDRLPVPGHPANELGLEPVDLP